MMFPSPADQIWEMSSIVALRYIDARINLRASKNKAAPQVEKPVDTPTRIRTMDGLAAFLQRGMR